MDNKTLKYSIWHIKRDIYKDVYIDYMFNNKTPDKNHYEKVYENYFTTLENLADKEILELLFEKFNLDHPKDYHGHSMSVTDIVILNGIAYMCCSIGFKEINEWQE